MIIYVVILLLILSLVLIIASRKESTSANLARKEYGIPKGKVIYTDLDRPANPLFSKRFMIVGKPDYIVKDDHLKALIPVEVKSGTTKSLTGGMCCSWPPIVFWSKKRILLMCPTGY